MKLPVFRLVLVAIVLQFTARGAMAQGETPNAEALLQKMAETYAAARSYSDTSFARYLNADGSERFHVDFKIAFQRPASIRIDAESKAEGALPRREVLWSDGTTIRMWSTGKPVVAQAKVKIAGSGLFGTYAYHIPTLLEESFASTRRLHELAAPVIAGEEAFEGVECYHIKGQWEGDAYEVWIGKEDFLVRRVLANHGDHRMEEIHREVVLNGEIAPEVFRFAPEKEAVPGKGKKPTPTPSPKGSPTPKSKYF
jgi:outer membrane lipoprotein-sorting protein